MIAKNNSSTPRLPPWRRNSANEAQEQVQGRQASTGNDGGILAVLSLLSETASREKELRPQMKLGIGVVYDLGSGLEVGYDKLRGAEKRGILSVSGSLTFAACPKCDDLNLHTQLFCPECSAQDLFKSDLLIHYECQSTGPVSEFRSRLTSGYYCHKCRKELKRVGIDYGNPGIGFKCSSCEKVFQFPLVLSRCMAGHTSKVDEINLRTFPKYSLGGTAEGLSSLLVESRNLRDELAKQNIATRILASLKGSSGANHVIPLLLVPKDAGETEGIAIEFVNDESNIEQSILQLLMKSADLENLRMLVILKGKHLEWADQIRSVVNPAKIRVLQTSGGTEELTLEILRDIMTW